MNESITRILVPVDFSPHSDRAARYAAALAAQVGASVQLVHVVEDLTYGAFSEVYVPNLPDIIQDLVNNATRRLGLVKEGMFPHGADVQTALQVHAILASLYLDRSRFTDALREFEAAIRIDDTRAAFHRYKGLIYQATARPGDAARRGREPSGRHRRERRDPEDGQARRAGTVRPIARRQSASSRPTCAGTSTTSDRST